MYENHWGIKPYEYDDEYDDYLMHYGIKGMKWKNHVKKAKKYLKKGYKKVRDRVVYGPSTYSGVYSWMPAGYANYKIQKNLRKQMQHALANQLFTRDYNKRKKLNDEIFNRAEQSLMDPNKFPKRLRKQKFINRMTDYKQKHPRGNTWTRFENIKMQNAGALTTYARGRANSRDRKKNKRKYQKAIGTANKSMKRIGKMF